MKKEKPLSVQDLRTKNSLLKIAYINYLKEEVQILSIKKNSFHESKIFTKARLIQMSKELAVYCQTKIQDLLEMKLIRPSKSPWSCSAFL